MKVLCEIIAAQQKGHENEPLFMIGEQLKEIAEREPISRELITRDLQIPEMNLSAAAAMFQKYSDDNHKNARCFCITPAKAEELLRKFYGLPERETAQGESAGEDNSSGGYIDLSSFL